MIDGPEEISGLAALLKAADPAHVDQGLFLAESVAEPETLDALLAGTRLIEPPRFERTYGHEGILYALRCCRLGPPLAEGGPFTDLAALLLMFMRSRLQPDRPASTWASWEISSRGFAPDLHALTREIVLTSGPALFEEQGPRFDDPESLIRWLAASDWRTVPLEREAEILQLAARWILDHLPEAHNASYLPPALREHLLPAALQIGAPERLSLRNAQIARWPKEIPLDGVRELDVSWSRLEELPPLPAPEIRLELARSALKTLPDGVRRLSIGFQQWANWREGLQGVRELEILMCHGLPYRMEVLLGEVESLGLQWVSEEPILADRLAEQLQAMPRLTTFSLEAPLGNALSAGFWAELPPLERLYLDGLSIDSFPPEPPPGLSAVRLDPAILRALSPAWRAIAVADTRRSIWLIDAGKQRIAVIKYVRQVTGLGLRDAKGLVDRAPSLMRRCRTGNEARQLRGALTRLGARAVIR